MSVSAVSPALYARGIPASRRLSSSKLNHAAGKVIPADGAEMDLVQVMAEMAAIGLIQERALRERTLLAEQLQAALISRVVIEQAKGMLAEYLTVTVDDAFRLLRNYVAGVRGPGPAGRRRLATRHARPHQLTEPDRAERAALSRLYAGSPAGQQAASMASLPCSLTRSPRPSERASSASAVSTRSHSA